MACSTLTSTNQDHGSRPGQDIPLKPGRLQGRSIAERPNDLGLAVKIGVVFGAALAMSEAIHRIASFGLPVALGGGIAIASLILYARAKAKESEDLEAPESSQVSSPSLLEDFQKIESNFNDLVPLKGQKKMIEGIRLGASHGVNVSKRDWIPILYIADQIFLKSNQNVPDDQLNKIFDSDQIGEMKLFKKSRYFIALTMAMKYYIDDNLKCMFAHICDGKAAGISQKTINLLERKFLQSTEFWFPMEMKEGLVDVSMAEETHLAGEKNLSRSSKTSLAQTAPLSI